MENSYIIHGGKSLSGRINLSGSKNIALKTLIAALMFDSAVELRNIPAIDDVLELVHLIKLLGGKIVFEKNNIVKIDGRRIKQNKVDLLHGSRIRVSFMLFAPLLLRFGEAHIPNPGGCRLGARSIDRIVEGMKAFGINVNYDSSTGYYKALLRRPVSGRYEFNKPSHTGTELLIMTGLLSESGVTIENAALEPEIDDLIAFLNESGAGIKREGRKIIVKKAALIQKQPYTIASDRNEAITFASLAIATKGDITVSQISETYIKAFIDKLEEAGGGAEAVSPDVWRFYYKNPLKPADVVTEPFPGFMTDWQPLWATLMTQAAGQAVIHERLFENRFSYVEELCKLGASIDYIDVKVDDPHNFYHFNYIPQNSYRQAIRINGGSKLHNGVVAISDLRAGATLAIAALSVAGESVVTGVVNIKRGYEDFISKIRSLGGNISEV